MSEETYHARIELLARRKVVLERRRMAAIEKAIELDAIGSEPKIVAGHRRQGKRLEELIVEIEKEVEATCGPRSTRAWRSG